MSRYSDRILAHGADLKFYFRLGEATGSGSTPGSAVDATGHITTASYYSGSEQGFSGGALLGDSDTCAKFNHLGGGATLVILPDGTYTDIDGPCSFEIWFKPYANGDATGDTFLFGKGSTSGTQAYGMVWFRDSGINYVVARFAYGGGIFGNVSVPIPTLNEWYHVVMTFSGTQEKMYLNGVLVSTGPTYASRNLNNVSQDLNVGAMDTTPGKYISAYMDEFAAYGIVLDAATVLAHYTEGAYDTVPVGTPRSFFLSPRSQDNIDSDLVEILDEVSRTIAIALKPKSALSGDTEFAVTAAQSGGSLGSWTVDNASAADSINTNTDFKSKLSINGGGSTAGWSGATRAGTYLRQTISGDFDECIAIEGGSLVLASVNRQYTMIAQSTSNASDWIQVKFVLSTDFVFQLADTNNDTTNFTTTAAGGPANSHPVGGRVWLRIRRSGNDFTGYYGLESAAGITWTSITTVTRSDWSADCKLGPALNIHDTSNAILMAVDYIRSVPFYTLTTRTHKKVYTSAADDTRWDLSSLVTLINAFLEDGDFQKTLGAGTYTFQFGGGNSNPPSLNGSSLTLLQLQKSLDPIGKYFIFQVEHTSSDGYKRTVYYGGEIDMYEVASGGSVFSSNALGRGLA